MENEIAGQSKNEWMKDFYKLNKKGKVSSVRDDFSTTELGLIKRVELKYDNIIIDIFKEFNLIPSSVDHNLSAHSRFPIDMIFHG